jgi:hypothetical protein
MNSEMLEGQCDGTYKRIAMERSNLISDDTRLLKEVRQQLNSGINGYGIFEAPVKRTGDGRFCR